MFGNCQALKRRNSEDQGGFTLFEILIVIVVLGILAAVVIYALGGIGSKSAVAACEADGSTISSALSDFNNQNPTLFQNVPGSLTSGVATTPTTYSSATEQALLSSNSLGGPWVQSWPNNYPHYAFGLAWVDQVANTSVPGNWTLTLQVATGNKQSGSAPNFTYAAAGAAGNLVPLGTSPGVNFPGSNYAPWITYSGPGACTGVS